LFRYTFVRPALCLIEPTALGRLKIGCYAEVPEQDEHVSLLSIYGYRLAIGYFGVVKVGGVSSPSFLGGFRGWGLVLAVWTPLRKVVLIWLASRWGEIAVRRHPGYVEKVKLVWRCVILNSLFRFCVWHTGRLPSIVYDALKS
jgi:hypothetical protein